MDLSTVTDIKELKAMAYDLLMSQQQVENNLLVVNQRIQQLNADQQQYAEQLALQVAQEPVKKSK